MRVPDIDKLLGIECYATTTPGIGGFIRRAIEDFVVEEILIDGSRARVNGESDVPTFGGSLLGQDYLLCVLVKRGWDMFSAVNVLAKAIDIRAGQIDFGGIKDAHALTAQYVTVAGVSSDDVTSANVKDIRVQPLRRFHERLSSYFLLGNSFHVVIRGIPMFSSAIEDTIVKTVDEVAVLGGLPNFYGHQRFGTVRPITHLVGKALIKEDYREAAKLFLTHHSLLEHPESRHARMELEATLDYGGALKAFPVYLRYERLMLSRLAEKPEDYVGAFRYLPVKLNFLFFQAYQSYLFNRFLSQRLMRGIPLNMAEEGDYVMHVDRLGIPMPKPVKVVDASNRLEINRAIKNGKMCVALPLVGVGQKTSRGIMGKIEEEVLSQEGTAPEDFRVDAKFAVKARGGLRAAVTPVKDFSIVEAGRNYEGGWVTTCFTLLRGSYATVLLREIMKPEDPVKSGF